jgi:phosphocarrier protein HPr
MTTRDFAEADDSGGLRLAEITVPNRKGLHARASAQFVKTAAKFSCDIKVTRDGQTVGGDSIMGLMMLGAGQGQAILVEADGADSAEALDALIALVESGFGEED